MSDKFPFSMASADCATVAHRLTARWLKSGWQSASMSLDVLVGTKPCAYARNANCPECELPFIMAVGNSSPLTGIFIQVLRIVKIFSVYAKDQFASLSPSLQGLIGNVGKLGLQKRRPTRPVPGEHHA